MSTKKRENTPSFPKRNTSPRGDAAIRKCHTNTVTFVQLAKDALGLLTKKKKKFYDFCVRCHVETEKTANQSKGCDAKLKGLKYGSQLHFSEVFSERHTSLSAGAALFVFAVGAEKSIFGFLQKGGFL